MGSLTILFLFRQQLLGKGVFLSAMVSVPLGHQQGVVISAFV